MKTILYIAPDISVKGGISTVIKGLLSADLSQKFKIVLVSSHVDGSKLRKAIQGLVGLIESLCYLAFKRVDIVHMHGGDITSVMRKYVYFRLVKLFKCKVIYHFHGASFMEQYPHASPGWKDRIRSLLEESDTVICLSESWRRSLIEIAHKSNVRVVYNSVALPALDEDTEGEREIVNITFLGLIGERKGVFDLIEVVSRLIADGHRVHLTIGGNGDISRLHNEIEVKDLKDYVTYVGWIVGDAKDKLLRNTDIFVLPSYGEGMPMTILEAMSYGIPVITCPVGGIPELVIDGEAGFLVSPGDLEGLRIRIFELISDKEMRLRFGNSGRQAIERKHNLAANIKIIENIYETI